MKLSGLMIGSEQPDVLGEFYTKLFGTPGWQQDNWYGFDIGGGTLMVGPHSEVHGQNSDAPRIMTCLVCEDVQASYNELIAKGATKIAEAYQPNPDGNSSVWLATVADPDGNYLQLQSPW